ncbi:MAG: hypothetical protein KU37_08135 [Sulfuricurvum sp. PC08-66]|nr:MAG: hypothetical protein KU37_08135 [Sulfuricurvum sp. PC08-66]
MRFSLGLVVLMLFWSGCESITQKVEKAHHFYVMVSASPQAQHKETLRTHLERLVHDMSLNDVLLIDGLAAEPIRLQLSGDYAQTYAQKIAFKQLLEEHLEAYEACHPCTLDPANIEGEIRTILVMSDALDPSEMARLQSSKLPIVVVNAIEDIDTAWKID